MPVSYHLYVWIPILLTFGALLRRRLRVRSVPGPFLASFTDLWRWYYQNFDNFTLVLTNLHEKYGSTVRLGPNTVSFSDPTVIPLIYTAHGEFKKANSYHPLRTAANGEIKGSVIDLQDEAVVSQVRRAVGGTFATQNVLDYEDDADATVELLLTAIREKPITEVFDLMARFQADFLLNIAFDQSSHYLETGAETKNLSFEARYKHWMRWQAMPILERLIYKPPVLIRYLKARAMPLWARMATSRLQARLASKNDSTIQQRRPDLLDKYIESANKRGDDLPVEVIPRMVSSTISAGFDTTAFTITSMLYYLCKNPVAMQELRAELDAATLSSPPRHLETQRLKYLSAIMKESMRLYPFLRLLLEREVPAGGTIIGGKFLAAGTIVGCHASVTGFNKALYGRDAHEFRPARWLQKDENKVLAMERAALGFGSGKRICIGRHLAEMEVQKVISAVITSFEVELADSGCMLEPADNFTSFPKPIWMRFKERPRFQY